MEQYIWSRDGTDIKFKLTIGDEYIRFDNEGSLQEVKLYYIDDTLIFPEDEIYETTWGVEFALNHFREISNEDQFYLDDRYFDEFKSWLLTSLTPLNKQRTVKITNIKNKIYGII